MRPDLTSLRVFLAVHQLGNITKAAEQEHIAPSAISKRLQALEVELGTELFYRHARGVETTPAGNVLARHVLKLLDDLNQMSAELSEFGNGMRGQVRIHAHTSVMIASLPEHIASFSTRFPQVEINLRESSSATALEAVADGVADIGIVAGSMKISSDLQTTPYMQDRLVVYIPTRHPLSSREIIAFEDLRDSDYISLEEGSSLQILLSEAAEAAGFELKPRIEVARFESAKRMVEAGLGLTVLPERLVEPATSLGQVSVIHLSDSWAQRSHVLCVRRGRQLTAAATQMLNHLVSYGV